MGASVGEHPDELQRRVPRLRKTCAGLPEPPAERTVTLPRGRPGTSGYTFRVHPVGGATRGRYLMTDWVVSVLLLAGLLTACGDSENDDKSSTMTGGDSSSDAG